MDYKNVLLVDEKTITERQQENTTTPKYHLSNYGDLFPDLDKDFYLKSFIRQALIDIRPLELHNLIQYSHDYSNSPDKLLSILEYELVPLIDELLDSNFYSPTGGDYYDSAELDYGLIRTNGRVIKHDFEIETIRSLVAFKRLGSDIKKRREIIMTFIEKEKDSTRADYPRLKWKGDYSHLCIILNELVSSQYLDQPTGKSGDVNYTEFARQVLNSFEFEETPKLESLRKYISPESERNQVLKDKFSSKKLHIPDSRDIG